MHNLFAFIWLISILAFIVYWWKKRKARLAAGEDYQNDPNYQSKSQVKRIIGIVSIASFVLAYATTPDRPPTDKTQVATEKVETKTSADKKSDLDGKSPEELIADAEKAYKEFDKQAEEERLAAEKKAQEEKAAADKKAKEEEKAVAEFNKKYGERIAKLSDDNKAFYEKTFQELLKEEGLFSKHKYTEDEAREEALERALNKQRQDDKKAKDKADMLAQAKERMADWEEKGKLKYQYLDNGSVNIILTESADFKLHGASNSDKIDYMLHDEHEKNIITTASQCMDMVQKVKEAGIQADNFEIHLRGKAVDSAGYTSVEDIVICEISGNKNFKKDDAYSFYNSVSRFWMMDGL